MTGGGKLAALIPPNAPAPPFEPVAPRPSPHTIPRCLRAAQGKAASRAALRPAGAGDGRRAWQGMLAAFPPSVAR